MAWYKDVWCLLTVVELPDDVKPLVVLSIHRTKGEARTLSSRLVRNGRWPATTRLMKYTRYIRDLREGDVLCCHKINTILNYFERELDSDAIREEV
nr:MAG TPA: hypothetical protein [Caudoviricetes sp.]